MHLLTYTVRTQITGRHTVSETRQVPACHKGFLQEDFLGRLADRPIIRRVCHGERRRWGVTRESDELKEGGAFCVPSVSRLAMERRRGRSGRQKGRQETRRFEGLAVGSVLLREDPR